MANDKANVNVLIPNKSDWTPDNSDTSPDPSGSELFAYKDVTATPNVSVKKGSPTDITFRIPGNSGATIIDLRYQGKGYSFWLRPAGAPDYAGGGTDPGWHNSSNTGDNPSHEFLFVEPTPPSDSYTVTDIASNETNYWYVLEILLPTGEYICTDPQIHNHL